MGKDILEDLELNEDGTLDDDSDGNTTYDHFNLRRSNLGRSSIRFGNIDDRTVCLIHRAPRCNFGACKMFRTGECTRAMKNETDPCRKIVAMMIPVLDALYDEYGIFESNVDFINIGLVMAPKYIMKFSLFFGIGSWGDVDEIKRQELAMRYDAQILAVKRDFDRKLPKK